MSDRHIQDRAAGAIFGAWIGDALGLGPHWYYDLKELRRDYGNWIDGYTDPKPGRYHDGLKAGQLSQSGFILTLMVRSLIARGGYDEKDFCHRMDQELFPFLDGTPMSGPGRYTSQSIREAWGAAACRRIFPGVKPGAMPIPPKPSSAPLPLPSARRSNPVAYYLSVRFHNDFESAVLHAVNGGGQNQVRAILTGALTGAQTGLSGNPQRFLNGLENADHLRDLAAKLALQATTKN